MGATRFVELYDSLISHWSPSQGVVRNGGDAELPVMRHHPDFNDPREVMMFIDSCSYLPDDILTKVDRASMAVSLEARVPFLDHRLVELSWRIPLSAKMRDGQGKNVLRDVLYRRVPKELIDRPKMGFGVPIERWLSGALRPWAEDLLDERKLRDDGIFEVGPIRRAWEEQLSGRRRNHYLLWDILMFQAWWRLNK
jgi:asparagine synthase (glutamine-hydrolysing)